MSDIERIVRYACLHYAFTEANRREPATTTELAEWSRISRATINRDRAALRRLANDEPMHYIE